MRQWICNPDTRWLTLMHISNIFIMRALVCYWCLKTLILNTLKLSATIYSFSLFFPAHFSGTIRNAYVLIWVGHYIERSWLSHLILKYDFLWTDRFITKTFAMSENKYQKTISIIVDCDSNKKLFKLILFRWWGRAMICAVDK